MMQFYVLMKKQAHLTQGFHPYVYSFLENRLLVIFNNSISIVFGLICLFRLIPFIKEKKFASPLRLIIFSVIIVDVAFALSIATSYIIESSETLNIRRNQLYIFNTLDCDLQVNYTGKSHNVCTLCFEDTFIFKHKSIEELSFKCDSFFGSMMIEHVPNVTTGVYFYKTRGGYIIGNRFTFIRRRMKKFIYDFNIM